jgi:hypothetical protein
MFRFNSILLESRIDNCESVNRSRQLDIVIPHPVQVFFAVTHTDMRSAMAEIGCAPMSSAWTRVLDAFTFRKERSRLIREKNPKSGIGAVRSDYRQLRISEVILPSSYRHVFTLRSEVYRRFYCLAGSRVLEIGLDYPDLQGIQ